MELNGWIKLHRQLLSNPVFHDETAFKILIWLLLKVDRTTGKITIGRFWASTELHMNPSTFYKAVTRLSTKYHIISVFSNNKNSEVYIDNWAKFQSIITDGNIKVTTGEQQSNTIQEVKNIKNKEKPTVSVVENVSSLESFGNQEINVCIEYFKEKMHVSSESCTIKTSRMYWRNMLANKGYEAMGSGIDAVKKWIDIAVMNQSEAFPFKVTSSRDLFYKRADLFQKYYSQKQGKKPIVITHSSGREAEAW